VNPALAETTKLVKLSPPRSHPPADRSVTLVTLRQLIASAPGGAAPQPTTRRARERSMAFVHMGTSFRYPRSKRALRRNRHATELDEIFPRLVLMAGGPPMPHENELASP
jgi:hypothetical protein